MDTRDCVSVFFQCEPDTKLHEDDNQDASLCSETSEELSLSQLFLDVELIGVEPFFNIIPRRMPQSPHSIIEEEFTQNPWAMLVATIFLTKTTGKSARPYMRAFFQSYPTPYHVISINPTCLEQFFVSLGLKKRAQIIWKMSYQFVSAKWRRASDLYGIGKYGEDAYRLFCLAQTDLEPSDRYLRLYIDWIRRTDFEIDSLFENECLIDDPLLKYYRLTLREGD